jgi:hypothetical protein
MLAFLSTSKESKAAMIGGGMGLGIQGRRLAFHRVRTNLSLAAAERTRRARQALPIRTNEPN